MQKRLGALTAIAFAAIAVSNAQAQENERWPRWYLGLSGSLTFLNDSDVRGASSGKQDYNSTGGGVNFSLGYMPPLGGGMLGNFRIEAEGGYHTVGLDSYVLNGTPGTSSGRTSAWSYMGNLYYDFRNASRWTPYMGAGAGGADVKLSKTSGLGNTSDHDNVFAYQFMAGLSYAPQSIPLTEWNLGYRYFATQNPEFATATGPIKLTDYNAHNVEVGAKFRF